MGPYQVGQPDGRHGCKPDDEVTHFVCPGRQVAGSISQTDQTDHDLAHAPDHEYRDGQRSQNFHREFALGPACPTEAVVKEALPQVMLAKHCIKWCDLNTIITCPTPSHQPPRPNRVLSRSAVSVTVQRCGGAPGWAHALP